MCLPQNNNLCFEMKDSRQVKQGLTSGKNKLKIFKDFLTFF
jgi:hypothetical protein